MRFANVAIAAVIGSAVGVAINKFLRPRKENKEIPVQYKIKDIEAGSGFIIRAARNNEYLQVYEDKGGVYSWVDNCYTLQEAIEVVTEKLNERRANELVSNGGTSS